MSSALTLAITKIGDLLLDNKISQDEEGKPIDKINLVIPPYQRPYKWTAKNAVQLFDDIIEAKNQNKETYRVGTLILHFDAKKSIYNIVDGQQRTITFSLLLLALNDGKNVIIPFLNQMLTADVHNARNIPNNYRTLERRIHNISDVRERSELNDYIKNIHKVLEYTLRHLLLFINFHYNIFKSKKIFPLFQGLCII